MTVVELLDRIAAAYPGATPEALKTFKPVFYARLKRHEGDALEAAATEVLGSFKSKYDQKFPIPVDFEAQLPSSHPRMSASGPALDFKARGERCRRLMAEWRAGQGKRGSNGVTEVLRALEFIAEPLANVRAWSENPEPIVLTGKQLRLAQHRAISSQRRIEHGALPRTNEEWWEQISAIAARWGIATAYEDWATKKQPRAEAA